MPSIANMIRDSRARLASVRAHLQIRVAASTLRYLQGLYLYSSIYGTLGTSYARRLDEETAGRHATGRIDAAVGRLLALPLYQHVRPCSEVWID